MPTKTKDEKPKTHALPLWSSPLKTSDGRILPTHGERVCNWIEANARHGEGELYGERVELRGFQKRWIYRLYEFYPETGRRRYKRAIKGVGKGNGKTPEGAWIGGYELAGGTQVAPRVVVGAASLKQANLVFGDLGTCFTQSPTLAPLAEVYDLQILLKDRPGVAERIAAEAGTNDGIRATAFIADELHEWEGRTARVFMVVDGGVAKRVNAFTLGISTADVLGESLLNTLYDHGVAVAKGLEVDDAFLFEWYEAPEGLDLDDPDQWLEAVYAANPAAGDFLDIENLRYRFQTMPRFEFERYHLNRRTSSHNAWIPLEQWDTCNGEANISEGDEVWGGIDGAAKRDTTAVYLARVDGDEIPVRGRIFEPPGNDEVIDAELVKNHIRELTQTHDVREWRYDPMLFGPIAQELSEEGLNMVEIPQTVPRKMSYAQALYDSVIQGRLRHGGDPVLRAHADAAVAKDRGNGWTLEKLKASRPIDALVAAAMAIEGAVQNEGQGEPGITVIEL